MFTIQQKTYIQFFTIITWYKHDRTWRGTLLWFGRKLEETFLGVNPTAFFTWLKLPGQSVSHHATGNRMALFCILPRLYQVLIDLQFYILYLGCVELWKRSTKIGDWKILIWMMQTIPYVRVLLDFEAVVVSSGSFSSHCWFCLAP